MNANVAFLNHESQFSRDSTLTAPFWFAPQDSTSREELDMVQNAWRTQQGTKASTEAKLVIKVSGNLPPWLSGSINTLNTILALKQNWDSYGAYPIHPKTAVTTIQILMAVMKDRTPSPAIVPTPSGSIQLEWHRSGIDLEVEITPNGHCSVSYKDETGQSEPWDGNLTHHPAYSPQLLSGFIEQLTQRVVVTER